MEKRTADDEDREQNRRSLTSCTTGDYQIKKSLPSRLTNENEQHYPPIILPSDRMNSPHYTSNPSLSEDKPTSPFRLKTNKLHHAKSHHELYQPNHSPLKQTFTDANPSESPRSVASLQIPTTERILLNTTEPSPAHKIPLWKRFKKMIVPKRRKATSSKTPTLFLDEISENLTNQTVAEIPSDHFLQNPLKVSELKTWINPHTFPEQQIRNEFQKLPSESLHPKTVALRPENKPKNRFNLIEPYDHSRVILRTLPHDYINASYIDGYKTKQAYIAAQAPMDGTLYDFIRMIWQFRISSIVMLTRLFEDGKHKCVQYWPDQGEKQMNNFIIRLDNEEKYNSYTIRRLSLTNPIESTEVLIIKQFHCLSWPDHDCLSLPTPLLDFRQRFRADQKKSISPILVHCSAGVGRSGTFIALDALLEMSTSQEVIDVMEFTHRMRENRVYMIQTVEQYVFLYRTLIEGILTMNTSVSLPEFLSTRKLQMDIKDQYKLLEQFQSTVEFSYRAALDPINIEKNREQTILAADNNRPYLMTQVEKGTDYINAVFVNSYRQASYIVTQYPLPHTMIDFCRLLYDHNISIIMLVESISHNPDTLPYWPSSVSQSMNIGPFEIVLTSQKEDDYLIERVLQIKLLHKTTLNIDPPKTIRQFEVKDKTRLLPIVKRFLKEMRTRPDQNILVQCLNGTRWSGYFLSLCNSIDQMQTEQLINPFQIVRLLRVTRSQFINQNQYENLFPSLFDYAQEYLLIASSSTHAVENSVYMTTSEKGRSLLTK